MSQENVEIALAAVDAWNRGDREAWLVLWDEEAEFYPLRAQLEGESYSGHRGLTRFLAEMTQDFEEVRFEIEERETPVSRWLVLAGSGHAGERAASTSTFRLASSRGSSGARSSTRASSRSQQMPSKPPGCRSRPADGVLPLT